jgi:hypothetical protein
MALSTEFIDQDLVRGFALPRKKCPLPLLDHEVWSVPEFILKQDGASFVVHDAW